MNLSVMGSGSTSVLRSLAPLAGRGLG
jgi:hypothetical protein